MKQWELAGVTVAADGSVVDAVPERPRDSVRVLVDQLPGIVWTTDTALRLTSLFGEGLGSLRLGPNQIVGWNLFDFAGEADWPMVVAHREALLGRVGAFSLEWAQRHFQARVGPLRDAAGDLIGTVCVAIERDRAGSPASTSAPAPGGGEPVVLP
jgi:hypothetical protein